MMRLYAIALRLLPRDVRDAHGVEMCAVFEQLLRDQRRRVGWRGVLRAIAAELVAVVHFAWCARRGRPLPRRIDDRLLAWPDGHDLERTTPMRRNVLQDLRYALRLLARSPGVSLACIVTMGLAIGANTAVFSLVHGILLKPLPFPDQDRLVVLGHRDSNATVLNSTTPGNFYDWQSRTTAFDSMAGFAYTQRILERGEFAERVLGVMSAGSIFDVLRRGAADGRTFTAEDDAVGAPAVIVLKQGFAQRLFGETRSVGQTLRVGGLPFTVIGVMPDDFAFPDHDAQYWLPARFDAAFRQNRDQFFLLAVARRRDDVTPEQALTQLNTVMDGIRREFPQHTQNATAGVMPLMTYVIDSAATRLWLLMAGVVLVLVIACANIANLLLARGSARRREMAMRHALGARSSRLVQQVLTESMLLSVLGGIAGVLMGAAMLRALVLWLPDDLPRVDGVTLDGTVLTVTAAVSILCGLAFGVWPALQLSTSNTADAVRHGTRETGRHDHMRSALVVTQVALSLTLLAGAGLLARSFANLAAVRPGFEPAGVLSFTASLPGAIYRDASARQGYFDRALDSLRQLPGVSSVALSSTLPVAGRGTGAWFNILDRPTPPDQTPPAVPWRIVTPDYFSTIGIPLERGRLLTLDDKPEGPRAVVISESVERRFWPGESALGKRIYLGAPENRLFEDAEIVGVVGDVKQTGLGEEQSEAVYIPHRMMAMATTLSFALRTAGEPLSLAAAARAELRKLDPAVPITDVRTMEDVVARSLAPERSSMYLLALFAIVALVLSAIGIFGVLSYSVTQRSAELAMRVALGATSGMVLRLVLRQGMQKVAIGIVLGLLLCVSLSRYIRALLFNVAPIDAVTLIGVSGLLSIVALAAIYVPSRRAARLDPVQVLRES